MTIFKKKATDIQETKKLPMTGKVKKGFRAYCTMVIVGALALGMTTTAFAANDPLTVVNNLSDFIFGLIRAIGMILLGFGIVQVGLSLKSHDPSQRANLWNGFTEEGRENLYTPEELFCCGYAPYFMEGIKLRYPEYCRDLTPPKRNDMER